MFHRRGSKRYVVTGSPWRRELKRRGATHPGRWLRVGALLAAFAALTLLACSDDRPDVMSDSPSGPTNIADELKQNAEAFEYTIGQRGGALTRAIISEPLTLNRALADDARSSGILGYLYDGLTEISWLTNQVEPSLAASWERSADGLTWTFHLRKDVAWHDGEPFTAHDVVFTFNRILYNDDIETSDRAPFIFRSPDPATGAWTEARMTVTALDDHTVRCVLPVPSGPFLRSMGTAIYPKHILEQHVNDGAFAEVWDIDTDPTEIIGTGPFTLASYDPGNRLVLQRNPDYWLTDDAGNRLPYLDELTYLVVADEAAELGKFWTGETDVLGVLGEWHAGLSALQSIQDFTIHRRGPTFGETLLAFNMNPGRNPETNAPYVAPEKLNWFRNTTFRQAAAYSVDRAMIVDDVQHGFGYPQWSSISPAAGDFHNPDVRRYEYDIGEANRLLDGLGWLDTDGDGIREDEAGRPITFSLITNTDNRVRDKIGRIIRQGLEDIGVKVEYQLVEFSDLVDRLARSYDWEALIIGFTGGPDPHGGISFWHSSGYFHLWHPNQASPATTWEAEIDDLYVRGSQELEHGERLKLYHRAQEIAAENVPVVYMTRGERLAAVRNAFGNTTPTLYGLWDIRYLYRTDQ